MVQQISAKKGVFEIITPKYVFEKAHFFFLILKSIRLF